MTLWASGYRNLLANRRRMMEAGMSSGGGYSDKVLGYDPIAYWPLWEAAGPTAQCLVNPAQNGTYVGVTLGQPGIGDGNTAPFFDGANDFVNIYSVALAAAFSGNEGTMVVWLKVNAAGVWTDAATRTGLHVRADWQNRLYLVKSSNPNQLIYTRDAAGATDTVWQAASPTAWFCMGITWSRLADEVKAYLAGAQVGATQAGLLAWILALSNTGCCIGAQTTTPDWLWHGWLAHAVIFDTPLTQPQLLDLATV